MSRLTTKVSFGSTVVSPFTVTATVRRAPGGKVRVPVVGDVVAAAVAVPLAVA